MTSIGSIYFPGTHVACLQVPQTEELQLDRRTFKTGTEGAQVCMYRQVGLKTV